MNLTDLDERKKIILIHKGIVKKELKKKEIKTIIKSICTENYNVYEFLEQCKRILAAKTEKDRRNLLIFYYYKLKQLYRNGYFQKKINFNPKNEPQTHTLSQY
jgi:hypothetical protein